MLAWLAEVTVFEHFHFLHNFALSIRFVALCCMYGVSLQFALLSPHEQTSNLTTHGCHLFSFFFDNNYQ